MISVNYQQSLENISISEGSATSLFLLVIFPIPMREYIVPIDVYSNKYSHDSSSSVTNYYEQSESYMELLKRINEIQNLPDDWNDNGAKMFGDNVINRSKEFLYHVRALASEISIFPTANNSLQIELERHNLLYCEAEIFDSHVEIYSEKYEKEYVNEHYSEISKSANKFIDIYSNDR